MTTEVECSFSVATYDKAETLDVMAGLDFSPVYLTVQQGEGVV